jgi:hypothetical protein
MQPIGSLLCSQEPSICPYPEPDVASAINPWLEPASELYRPTERLPLVGEVSANFSG